MPLKLNTASSGSVTLDAANTASNFTLTVPAQTGTVVASDSSGNVNIDSNTLYVDATNNRVGVGTSSPVSNLHLSGTLPILTWTDTNDVASARVYQDDNLFAIDVDYDNAKASSVLAFKVDAAERMRIDSSGNLLVGCTATPSASVKGSGFITNSTGMDLYFGLNTTSSDRVVWFYNPNGLVGGIVLDGSSTIYSTSSDYRLKENIAPMTGALSTVAQLKPVTYNWKADGSSGQGFIAHELAEVCPQAVNGEKDAVHEDGSINPQGIDTSFLVATLTAALQEQQAIITQLQADVAELKGQA